MSSSPPPTPPRNTAIPLYGISVVAELLDLPEATLRSLESNGVFTPSRTEGGTRRYSDDDLARIRRATDLRAEGVNVGALRRVLELEDANEALREELAEGGSTHPR